MIPFVTDICHWFAKNDIKWQIFGHDCVAKDNLNWQVWLNLSQVCIITSNVTSYFNDRYDRKCHVLKRTIGIMTNVTESVIDDKFNICHFSCTMSYVTKLQMQKCDRYDTLLCHMCHTICHICYICDRMSLKFRVSNTLLEITWNHTYPLRT